MATAWEQAYLTLRRRLADGTYPPGSRLREEDLAAQLGVSRTPVREALRRLDAEGWLRVVPNQGAFAADWSDADIEEVYDLRAVLESHAAEHAAKAGDRRQLAVMEAACDEAEFLLPAGDTAAVEAISDANVRFHRALWAMSGQVRCGAILSSLAVPPMALRNFRNFDAAGLRRSIDQHREMIAAIGAGDAAWASAVMRAHVQAGRAVFRAATARERRGRHAA
jgi:DNA-binding GntR family transcriptional regulator